MLTIFHFFFFLIISILVPNDRDFYYLLYLNYQRLVIRATYAGDSETDEDFIII